MDLRLENVCSRYLAQQGLTRDGDARNGAIPDTQMQGAVGIRSRLG